MIRKGHSKGRTALDDTHSGLSNPRKPKKLSLHSLSTVESKFAPGIPDVVAHKEHELLSSVKVMKKKSLNDSKTDNILQKIIPKYKPNSKITIQRSGTGQIIVNPTTVQKDKGTPKSSQIQPLKATPLELNHNNDVNNNSMKLGSCIKINSNATKSPPSRKSSKTKTGKKITKVRFDKKVTIHYVPSDEERGSYEWRKNLTRQGIYQAMLWKTELAKLEIEEADELIRSTSNNKDSLAAYGLLN